MPSTKCGFDDQEGGATGSQLLTKYGPTLMVDIGFDPDFEMVDGEHAPPKPGVTGIRALVDTGAARAASIAHWLPNSTYLSSIDGWFRERTVARK